MAAGRTKRSRKLRDEFAEGMLYTLPTGCVALCCEKQKMLVQLSLQPAMQFFIARQVGNIIVLATDLKRNAVARTTASCYMALKVK